MTYTKNVKINFDLTDEYRVLGEDFNECSDELMAQCRNYKSVNANAYGWIGEALEIEFNESEITTSKVIALVKKCYKTKKAIEC